MMSSFWRTIQQCVSKVLTFSCSLYLSNTTSRKIIQNEASLDHHNNCLETVEKLQMI